MGKYLIINAMCHKVESHIRQVKGVNINIDRGQIVNDARQIDMLIDAYNYIQKHE